MNNQKDSERILSILIELKNATKLIKRSNFYMIFGLPKKKKDMHSTFVAIENTTELVSKELKETYTAVPWKNLETISGVFIRNYSNRDAEPLWDSVKDEFTLIIKELKVLIKKEKFTVK